ncbi:MAG: hypothetical protein HY286_13000 [Planctomycetes bacterium]|nr:hypothetical protein [Planctomycetota bacterium]
MRNLTLFVLGTTLSLVCAGSIASAAPLGGGGAPPRPNVIKHHHPKKHHPPVGPVRPHTGGGGAGVGATKGGKLAG